MRTKIMVVLSVLILTALNYGIYEKEQIKEQGETLLLELAPVDPRSLMQGDYMRLRYAIERTAPAKELSSHQKRGYIVIRPDENNVGQFIRFHKEEDLAAGEKLLHFHKQYRRVRIVPDSFFFQEGHAKHYENAKYGVFKFDNSGKHLLVGLADEAKQEIKVYTAESKARTF
jgi:uncharacterized membrane-anchored protein